jgi:hypothetical protein
MPKARNPHNVVRLPKRRLEKPMGSRELTLIVSGDKPTILKVPVKTFTILVPAPCYRINDPVSGFQKTRKP